MKHIKTDLGQQAFKERSSLLSARQRSAFLMFDGVKTTEQILQAVGGLGVTQADIDYLVLQGFLADVSPATASAPGAAAPSDAFADPVERDSEFGIDTDRLALLSKQERYAMACTLATQLTSSLGLRGFRLNLAVQGAGDFDDLVNLLPKIQEAVGPKASRQLARVLKI
jgi:hypothetical protein